ncbi:hypothetical protein [Buttiauxella noackiae]|uniref:hypothetical protein n=1 Tax=Buttiauxella noackiae TaxID=82992 RepID=UPI00235623A6|nr:hypothetical protein [Buttiauxella noackiae]MCA1922987.1 hypothetical protein [Buttiauxella noackiae]
MRPVLLTEMVDRIIMANTLVWSHGEDIYRYESCTHSHFNGHGVAIFPRQIWLKDEN